MRLQVKYFASLRERLGRGEESLELGEGATVRQVWAVATDDDPMPDNMLCALNFHYVGVETAVADGDEVAFFPPVTGG